jgi:hypothetical protein
MSKRLVFLTLVQRSIARRGSLGHYASSMLKAADRIPEEMSAEQACAIFLRCVCGVPVVRGNESAENGGRVRRMARPVNA